MTVMNGELTIAGGVVKSQFKKKVAIWNVLFHNWQYPYLPMPTARSNAQLISYQHYLMAVGGVTYPVGGTSYPLHQTRGSPIMNVEILDTSRLQWYIAESLLSRAINYSLFALLTLCIYWKNPCSPQTSIEHRFQHSSPLPHLSVKHLFPPGRDYPYHEMVLYLMKIHFLQLEAILHKVYLVIVIHHLYPASMHTMLIQMNGQPLETCQLLYYVSSYLLENSLFFVDSILLQLIVKRT